MPLIKSIYPDKSSIIAIWRMEESLEYLKEAIPIRKEEAEKFKSLVHENRQREFLTVRLCLREIAGRDDLLITYNDLNKPDIKDEYFISISHTGDYVCIFLNREKEVGIDIEQLNDRVTRISSRFLSEDEKLRLPKVDSVKWLNLHWSAKETMYKVYAKKRLVFSTQMEIEKFQMDEKGVLSGVLKLESGQIRYPISYWFFEDFVLTYCEEV